MVDILLYGAFYASLVVAFIGLFIMWIDHQPEPGHIIATSEVGVERAAVMAGEEVVSYTVVRHRFDHIEN